MHNPARVLFRWKHLAALLCLLAHHTGGGKILAGILAVAAGLEGSHIVQTSDSASGPCVVRHHETRAGGVPAPHRHGSAAKVFCLLASADDPDHILQLSNGAAVENPSAKKLAPTAAKKPTPHHTPFPASSLSSVFILNHAHHSFSAEGPPPPPRAGDHLSALRITVLLI